MAEAARLRERADTMEAAASKAAESPLAEHFPVGVGFGGAGHRPDVHRYAERMREVSELRSRAASLETTARNTVFSDDVDGLRAAVEKHERAVADLVAKRADPEQVAKWGADVIRDVLASERRKLNRARKRLESHDRREPCA